MAGSTIDRILELEATRAAKAARMDELMQKAADAGVILDDAECDEYDTLEDEVKKLSDQMDEALDELFNSKMTLKDIFKNKADLLRWVLAIALRPRLRSGELTGA
jgi:seryl-tRNA synthetase